MQQTLQFGCDLHAGSHWNPAHIYLELSSYSSSVDYLCEFAPAQATAIAGQGIMA
jgi:hypothetical protein